jgi:hypothetical protein
VQSAQCKFLLYKGKAVRQSLGGFLIPKQRKKAAFHDWKTVFFIFIDQTEITPFEKI